MKNNLSIAYPLTIFFDGSCRLCRSEIENLAIRDVRQQLLMVDCSARDFDDKALPVKRETMMNIIHGRDADGHWISGVDVFIAAYLAAELDWASRFLMHRWVRPHADRAYPWLVRNRYMVSKIGLHRILKFFTHLAQRRQARDALARSQSCANGTCSLNKESTATPVLSQAAISAPAYSQNWLPR